MESGCVASMPLICCMLLLLLPSVVTAFLASSTTTTTTTGVVVAPHSSNTGEYRCPTGTNRWRSPWCALSVSTVGGDLPGAGNDPSSKPPLKVFRGRAGPAEATPVYDDTRPLDRLLLGFFRSKLAKEVGSDVYEEGYDGLMQMIRELNEKYPSKSQTQEASRRVLQSLFPSWLPSRFAVMFSKPFPEFSSRLNAWVTLIASQWLMGPSQLNDIEIDGGSVGAGHGLLVERCRFLEAAGCASVCMNTCKVPTEEFFMKDMGLALEMTPNYEDFSCQFSFNKTPLARDADEVFRVACFEQCPSRGTLREDKQVARCHQIDIAEG